MFNLIAIEHFNCILLFRNLSVSIVTIPEMLKFVLNSKCNVNVKHPDVDLSNVSSCISIILVLA
jgi:hypothetical protein